MTNIYVLLLKGGRYYIGKSDDVPNRIQQHMEGKGSAWTRKYTPVSLVKTIKGTSPLEEDKVTKEYMLKYGIDKVRGGAYVETVLSEFQKKALKTELWAANDLCTRCGRRGHFVKDCYAKTEVVSEEEDEEEEEEEEYEWGCSYCDRTFNTEFGCMVHEKSCRSTKKSDGACFRCGRPGHYSPDCYASKHINGYLL